MLGVVNLASVVKDIYFHLSYQCPDFVLCLRLDYSNSVLLYTCWVLVYFTVQAQSNAEVLVMELDIFANFAIDSTQILHD